MEVEKPDCGKRHRIDQIQEFRLHVDQCRTWWWNKSVQYVMCVTSSVLLLPWFVRRQNSESKWKKVSSSKFFCSVAKFYYSCGLQVNWGREKFVWSIKGHTTIQWLFMCGWSPMYSQLTCYPRALVFNFSLQHSLLYFRCILWWNILSVACRKVWNKPTWDNYVNFGF